MNVIRSVINATKLVSWTVIHQQRNFLKLSVAIFVPIQQSGSEDLSIHRSLKVHSPPRTAVGVVFMTAMTRGNLDFPKLWRYSRPPVINTPIINVMRWFWVLLPEPSVIESMSCSLRESSPENLVSSMFQTQEGLPSAPANISTQSSDMKFVAADTSASAASLCVWKTWFGRCKKMPN